MSKLKEKWNQANQTLHMMMGSGDASASALKAQGTRVRSTHRGYWLAVRKAQKDVEEYGWNPAEAAEDRDVELTDLISILGTSPPDEFDAALRRTTRRKRGVD